ncbi:MAG: hypothetical protein J1F02_00895 [Lachnospiraceae bacterium]|nr:hypothetical protein [Lachnospiraceae bacterium]
MKREIGLVMVTGMLLLTGCGSAVNTASDSSGGTVSEGAVEVHGTATASPTATPTAEPLGRMVKVDGRLYCESGECDDVPTCGTMDGTISSSVSGNKRPKKNDQSNFGKGYGYQWASEGIDIWMPEEESWVHFTEQK